MGRCTPRTREAPGPRSSATTSRLRGARCTIRRANAADGNAAPGTEIAVVERRKASALRQGRVRRKAQVVAPLGAPPPSPQARGGKSGTPALAGNEKGCPDKMTRMTKTKAHARDTDDEAIPTEAEQDAARRRLHNFLSFWRVCGEKRCKRGKGCRGDVSACAARHFPLVPDDTKAWLFKAFEGMRGGLSPQEAADAANKHVAEFNAWLAKYARRDAEAKAAKMEAPSSATPSRAETISTPHHGPPARVRVL